MTEKTIEAQSETFEPFPEDVQRNINLGPREKPQMMAAVRAATTAASMGPRITNLSVSSPSMEPDSSQISNGVPNPKPGFTEPVSEPEGVSMDLASRFAFYPFKDLYVKPFRVRQLGKLNKAREDSSLLHVVEAVSSVLKTSHGTPDLGFQLCVADFYHVLYWLRLHSFTKSSILHKTTCTNPAHLAQVADGSMPEDTLKISRIVTETEIKVTELEALPPPEAFVLETPGWFLRPATMRDTLEFTEHPLWLDSEFQYYARLASNLGYRDPASGEVLSPTLTEKVEAIQEWSPRDASLVSEFESLLDGFGVDESVQVQCKWCGASRKSKIILDAHSFLSAE